METVKVVTVNRLYRNITTYYRLSIYEFRGDPPKAFFIQDLQEGFWGDLNMAIFRGKRKAKDLNLLFVDNISMGDSIQKIFAYILS